MKEWITIFLAWWVVPITMIAFWLRYIPRHNWIATCFHIGLIVLSVAFAILFYRLCALTLQGKEKKVFQLVNFWRDRRFYYGISVFLVGVLFSLLSHGAIEGVRPTYLYTGGERKVNFYSIKEIILWAFKKVGYDVFVDFREKAVSEKPDRYWEIAENDLPKYVKGANLNNRNLTNADMYKAFLVNAHLRHAIVDGAYLIQEAKLGEANLQEANFIGAVNLTIEQLSKAKTLYQAKLDPELLGQVKKCCPHLLEKPKEETDKKDETK